MLKFLFASLVLVTALSPQRAAAQKATPGVYMQIFYEGPGLLAGRRILAYSPAFRGKTQELVLETDSTRQLPPSSPLLGPAESLTQTGYATVTTEKGRYIPDKNGKMHLETAAERQQERQRETERLNRSFQLLETRADLGRAVLTKALNETAADGWEIVQMTATGTAGSLVYLLRHR